MALYHLVSFVTVPEGTVFILGKTKVRSPTPPPLYLSLFYFFRQNFLHVFVVPCAQTSPQVPLLYLSLSWYLVICRLRSAARPNWKNSVWLQQRSDRANGCIFTAPITKCKIRSSLLSGKWHYFCIIFPKALASWLTWKRH